MIFTVLLAKGDYATFDAEAEALFMSSFEFPTFMYDEPL